MLVKYWPILVVDDEPDVLAISKLIMKGIRCYGVPTKVFTCNSKAEAVKFMEKYAISGGSFISVAFIDVVMETNEAGLELCNYIRNDINNWETQLLIRTGQAATYTERSVIDQYEISGYISKVEENEDKLYSLVKSSIRQYFYRLLSVQAFQSTHALIKCYGKKASIIQMFRYILSNLNRDGKGNVMEHMTADVAYFFRDLPIGAGLYEDEAKALADRAALLETAPLYTTAGGDRLIQGEEHFLIEVKPRRPGHEPVQALFRSNLKYSVEMFRLMVGIMANYQQMWRHLVG